MENLYHVGARAYDAERGRFTTRDGYRYIDQKNPLTANLYLYGQGNPLRFFDLDGHECIEEKSYLERILKMAVLGEFLDKETALGSVAGVGLGLLGVDLIMDVRNLVEDIRVNFEPNSMAWWNCITVDTASMISVDESLEYLDGTFAALKAPLENLGKRVIDFFRILLVEETTKLEENSEIEGLKKTYGFTEEQALLLNNAIKKLGATCEYDKNSAAYINYIYGTLSTLCVSYNAKRWRLTAHTPNLLEAKERLGLAGFSEQQILDLQVLISLQHGDFTYDELSKAGIDIEKSTFCDETYTQMMSRCLDPNNDFAHQIIQIAEFACEDMMLEEGYIIPGAWAVGLFNSSDFQHSYTKYEISFKGDIDSGRYSQADFQSDVDAINIYNRMKGEGEKSLNEIRVDYYQKIEAGDTNRAVEFFRNLGDGKEADGIMALDHILKKKTYGSIYIQKGNNMSEENVDKIKKIFVEWIFSEYYGFEYEVVQIALE